MKEIFADLATKILDTDLTILMPDIRAAELDVLLRPVYGLVDLLEVPVTHGNLFSVDYNRQSMQNRCFKSQGSVAIYSPFLGLRQKKRLRRRL